MAVVTNGTNSVDKQAPMIALSVIQLGPGAHDTLTLTESLTQNGFYSGPPHTAAITGGTGRFLGATGETVYGVDNILENMWCTLKVYVPKR